MKKVIFVVDNILKWFLIVIMGVNVINVLWQVFTRFILNNPSSFTEELARYLLIWVGVLGAAYAHRLKMHLAIDVLTERFTGNTHHYSRIFIEACVFLFALFVMFIGGANLVDLTLTLNQISAALQVKLGYVYSVIPISGLLIMFYSGLFIIDEFRALNGNAEPLMEDAAPKDTTSTLD